MISFRSFLESGFWNAFQTSPTAPLGHFDYARDWTKLTVGTACAFADLNPNGFAVQRAL
jgi:hypothetical protein